MKTGTPAITACGRSAGYSAMRRLGPLIASTLLIGACTPHVAPAPSQAQTEPPWPMATGTVLAQTRYGRITSVEPGAYSIELRETPLPPDRPEAERTAALTAIRQLVETPDLALSYRGLQRHPENTGMAVEVYASLDTEFMVDIQTNAVVYMQTLVQLRGDSSTPQVSPQQLEERVRRFLSQVNPCFDAVLGQLQLESGNKEDNTFFRWRSPNPNADRPWNQPTFVQVGIDVYGKIFGYIDSGICHLAAE